MARASWLVGLGVAVVLVILPAAPAAAAVGISASLTLPSVVAVGQTARPGSFSVTNTNTSPNGAESNFVTTLRLAPSCGTTSTAGNLCPQPDPGVFSVAATASGRTGTACGGRTFAVSAPDAMGAVTFTPQGGSLSLPAGGQCVVDFTFGVLKVPTIDASAPNAGVQTSANLLVVAVGSISGLVVSTRPTLLLTVVRATPSVAVQASRNVAAGTISATATISGAAGVATPTGTVTFSAFGPNDAACAGAPFASSTNALVGGTATSNPFPTTVPGSYRFVALYSGDANYAGVTSPCGAASASVVVTARSVTDFDGNGTTDRSLYRDGGWYVHGQSTVFFGLAGDVAVPGDYDASGDTERAVYRSGAWYVEGQPTVFFGAPGDVPVPGDYDGDGDTDRAIFRPSVGGWYVEGVAPVFLGQVGDIPVPGDYDGDGDTDRAVWRAGVWFVEGQPTVFLGMAGDIPVPGDYDGDGDTDRAVYRGGAWFVDGQATVFFGLDGHAPEPGDYDGNGTTDRAVYTNGAWYTQNQNTVFYGLASDVPLPLPQAIYGRFFCPGCGSA